MFEKSSAGNRSSSRDANYHQYRQALRYRSDRCSLGADQADVTGSPTRRPTTHNQHSRCVKRNLLSTTNRLPMAFASPESFQFGARSITTSESGRTVVSGTHVQRSMYQQARRQAGRTACPCHHGWPVGEDDGTWRHSRLRHAQACQRPQAPNVGSVRSRSQASPGL